MKAKRKFYLIAAVISVIILGTAVYQNCGGTQTRSTDFSISTSQAEAYLADVQCAVSGSSSVASSTATAVTNASTIINSDQGELFYSQAPSAMGDLGLVAPLNYPELRNDGGGEPQTIYGFFALGADGTGSLVIALSDAGASSGSSTPAPTAVQASLLASKLTKSKRLSFNTAHLLDGTSTSSSCSSSNPLNLTTAITAYNDGTTGLEPASFDGDIFEMELTPDGSSTFRIRSYDVQDGSLQSTIQIEVNEVDPNSGQEIYLGDINMTQPE